MRNEHLNYRRTMDNTLLIANLFRLHELNAQLTENALVLPETLGFKAEAVDEEGIWRPCTVEDVSNDPSSIVSFAAYVIHVRSEIERYQIAKERKTAINVKSQGKWQVIQSQAIASSSPLFRETIY